MIIEASKNETTIVSNITVGEVIEMTVSEEGMAYAMSSLSNMYNDPKMAVIREYFTNALDSHVKAGETAPIEVSLPTSYSKMYVVQDFGVGMDVDTIRKVYSKYWESTKRDSNSQIGAFGLGAKSALAIANQFTLASVKDGVKITVIVQKAGDGSGKPKMLVASAIETDEPNGVTVSIPVDDIYSFNDKARDFFRFVDPSLVRVDGYAPTSIFSSVTRIETDLDDVDTYVDMDQNYGGSYVVMGQVAYALTPAIIAESANRLGITTTYELRNMPVYFRVPIGSVNLTPNREGLLYDDKTNEMFDTLISAYMDSVRETAQEEIDAVENRFDAYDIVSRWENRLGGTFQWQGEDVIRKVKTTTSSSTIKRSWNDTSSHGNSYSIDLTGSANRIIVTGQPFDKYRRISNYITDYLEMMSLGHTTFYFREALDEFDTKWVTEHPHISFEDFEDMIARVKEFRKAKRAAARALLPKEQRDRPAKLEYPVLDIDSRVITNTPYDEIPAESYYIAAEDLVDASRHLKNAFDGKSWGAQSFADEVKLITGDGASIVFISRGRSVESFKVRTRKIDGLKNLKELASDVQTRVNDLMTEEVLRLRGHYLGYRSNRILSGFDQANIDQILDEDLRTLVSHPKPEWVEARQEAQTLWNAFERIGFVGAGVVLPTWKSDTQEKDASESYPLLGSLSGPFDPIEQEHIVRYINMVYADQLTLVDA